MRRAVWIVIVMVAGLSALAGAPIFAARPPSAVEDIRGLWVVRTSLTSRERIAAMVAAARSGGYNTLLVQVRGRGDAYHRSAIEPRSADLDGQPSTFDPLAVTLALAHAAGLRVHAWVGVDLVASAVTLPRAPSHIVRQHPEWLMVPRDLVMPLRGVSASSSAYLTRLAQWTHAASAEVEGLYLSPIPAASRDYTVKVIRDLVARYPVDGLHFDYVRYPDATFDYSAGALAAFRATRSAKVALAERQRLDKAARTAPTAWVDAFPDAWSDFRRERLSWLVHALASAARAARPHLVVSAAVVPRGEEARAHKFQDWPKWAAAGDLDVVCPMIYVSDEKEFGDLVAHARGLAGRVPLWTGIGAYRLPVADAAAQVRAAYHARVAGVLIFLYDSVIADASAGYLEELRPAIVGRK